MAYQGLGERGDRPGGIRFTIAVDIQAVEHELHALPHVSHLAISRALNNTARSVLAVARREVKKKIGLKNQKLIKNRMGYKHSTPSLLQSDVHISSRGILISQLDPTVTAAGLSYRLGGKTIIARHTFLARGVRKIHAAYGSVPYSFVRRKAEDVGTKESGAFGLVGRLPVRYAWGANPVATFMNKSVFQAMELRASEQWEKEIHHQVNYYLSRYVPRRLGL